MTAAGSLHVSFSLKLHSKVTQSRFFFCSFLEKKPLLLSDILCCSMYTHYTHTHTHSFIASVLCDFPLVAFLHCDPPFIKEGTVKTRPVGPDLPLHTPSSQELCQTGGRWGMKVPFFFFLCTAVNSTYFWLKDLKPEVITPWKNRWQKV